MVEWLQAEDRPDEGGLAAAVRAEEGDELALLDREVDVLEYVLAVELDAGTRD